MEKAFILSNLCSYDLRNPNCCFTEEEIKEYKPINCSCDNCFYGRTELAIEILRLNILLINDK